MLLLAPRKLPVSTRAFPGSGDNGLVPASMLTVCAAHRHKKGGERWLERVAMMHASFSKMKGGSPIDKVQRFTFLTGRKMLPVRRWGRLSSSSPTLARQQTGKKMEWVWLEQVQRDLVSLYHHLSLPSKNTLDVWRAPSLRPVAPRGIWVRLVSSFAAFCAPHPNCRHFLTHRCFRRPCPYHRFVPPHHRQRC